MSQSWSSIQQAGTHTLRLDCTVKEETSRVYDSTCGMTNNYIFIYRGIFNKGEGDHYTHTE